MEKPRGNGRENPLSMAHSEREVFSRELNDHTGREPAKSGDLSLRDLQDIQEWHPLFENVKMLYYVVRPSSFLLTTIWNTISETLFKRTKIYDNLASIEDEKELFAYVSSPDESFHLYPEISLDGWSITNSLNYSSSHRELNWV